MVRKKTGELIVNGKVVIRSSPSHTSGPMQQHRDTGASRLLIMTAAKL